MKTHFKSHLMDLKRYQTSSGRDLLNGLRLDRNEKVSNFSKEILNDIFSKFTDYSLSASPDAENLYNRIAEYLGMDLEEIYITSGITEAIRIFFETLTKPGDNVIVLDPTYPMYYVYSKIYQVDYRRFGYGRDMKPDWKQLYEAMDEKTAMVMIPNPNLPIESVFTTEEIETIVKKCAEYDIALIIDEAYHYFGGPTVIDWIKKYDNLIVTRTFSKAYGLAGLRIGYMVSNRQNIGYLSKTRSLVESNTLTMGIAEYMLDHPELRDQHVKEVKEGAAYLQKALTELGIRWHGGNVTNGMLIFLNDDRAPKNLYQYMRERKIYIRSSFEPPYSMCARVSIGPKSVMGIFIDQFIKWLNQRSDE